MNYFTQRERRRVKPWKKALLQNAPQRTDLPIKKGIAGLQPGFDERKGAAFLAVLPDAEMLVIAHVHQQHSGTKKLDWRAKWRQHQPVDVLVRECRLSKDLSDE